uniref:Toll receptor 13 n=1 Tax=Daphnia magna TaxID=35525 RepID=A0A0N8BWA0_9CRUS
MSMSLGSASRLMNSVRRHSEQSVTLRHKTSSWMAFCSCWSVHRDRRKMGSPQPVPSLSRFVRFLICFTVTVSLFSPTTGLASPVPSVPSDGCQFSQSSADGGVTSLHCRLRSFNADWSGSLSRLEQQSTKGLWVECADSSAYPVVLPTSAFAAFPHLDWLHVDSCRLSDLAGKSLQGLDKLRQLRVQTRNADWPGTSLTISDQLLNDVRSLESLDLALNDMRSLPSRSLCALDQLVQLNLTGNRLSDLLWANTETRCLPSLKVLDMSYNRLVTLAARSLANWTLLEELHLQGNGLVRVDDNSLVGLTSLRLVNLAGNQLTSLPPGLFSSSADHLAELYVSANGLTVLAPGLFRGLTQLLVLDLSENHLTSSSFEPTTLAGLFRLAVLSLHNNRISRLDATLFSDLTSLQILRLDGNMLETLADGVFSSLPHLHTLILSRNRLTRLDGQLMANLNSLSILALDNNLIEGIDVAALSNATQLQDLNLSGNNLPSVPLALAALTRLQSLDLGENRLVGFDHAVLDGMKELSSLRLLDNQIGNVSRHTFAGLPSLRILNLSKNQIAAVEEGAFGQNALLQAVRLDANELTDLTGLFHALPNLVWLNVSDNRLAHFDYALIPKSLQWLDMHLNHIPELGNYFQLDDQLSLQTLDASFNRLTELTASMLPDSLQVLSLNDNLISSVQPYTFFRKDNLTRVDLYANHIADLDQNALRISPTSDGRPLPEFYIGGNPFQCDCNMEWLQRINTPDHLRQHPRVMDLEGIYCRLLHSSRPQRSYVPLVEATPSNFLCTYETHCFALCHCCDFDACDCEMTCPTNCTCYHDQSWSANIVDCSGASHPNLPERIPMDVTELYLDGAQLGALSSHKFIGRKNLRLLFLNSSGVEIIHNRTFNGLRGLYVLHLEDNRIRTLEGFEFSDLESLRQLYLHNNAITAIQNRTFSALRHLQVLRLDGNRLVDFAVWNLLSDAAQLNALTLNDNPWSCDCLFLAEFRTALHAAGAKVSDASQLICVTNERDSVVSSLPILMAEVLDGSNRSSDRTLDRTSDRSVGLCVSPTPSATTIVQQRVIQDYLPLLVTTLVAFIAVTLLILLVFVYRQPVRVWCHARYGLRLWTAGNHSAATPDSKLFDAFLSYSAKDDAFVQQMLATNLEYGSPTYKLCLQHRDCPSGGGAYGLSETISQAVDSSRRTVMIISPNFIKAEWCRFEYKSALHQLFGTSRHCQSKNKQTKRLIVILIGDVTHKDLDADLKLYLKTNTYLQWGEDGFWDKLRFALPDPVQQANRTQQQQQQQVHQLPLQHTHQQQAHKTVRPCGGPAITTMGPAPLAATSAAMAAHQMHLHQQRSASRPCSVTIPQRTVTLNMSG